MLKSLRHSWFSNVPHDLLAGLVVALALIPEAIAFSMIAGVDPKVGLYASFCIATVIAFAGGRPGMISAATGAMAVVMVSLVKEHGLDYLLAATVLTGILQVLLGYLRVARLMRFVSRAVMTGFVNALAILIFAAQLPELIGHGATTYLLVALALVVLYRLPAYTTAVPAPLVAILLLTALVLIFGLEVRTVGDLGQLPDSLPTFLIPEVPFNLTTLCIIFPYAATLAMVGLLESLMTASIVDDLTDSPSNKKRECIGQGVANIITGFLGGMAGCAMIGQSVINVKSGGRGRLSTLTAGVLLLVLVVFASEWISYIPMAALVAIMIMVSIGTFDWSSLRKIRTNPRSYSLVVFATVVVVVITQDLAQGVLAGVLLSSFFFASKIARFLHISSMSEDQGRVRTYKVSGQVFFASAERFVKAFDFREVIEKVRIDVSQAHFWDITAISALDRVVIKFRREATEVEIIGLNAASSTLVDRFAVHQKPEAAEHIIGH